MHVADMCRLMADVSEQDASELRVELGVSELLGNYFGAVLICPPQPVAVYKEEDVGRLLLFSPRTG